MSLSGIITSASFLALSVFIPVSPKEINATIKKKRATVINTAKPAPAKYLLNSKALSTYKRTGLKIFSTACI